MPDQHSIRATILSGFKNSQPGIVAQVAIHAGRMVSFDLDSMLCVDERLEDSNLIEVCGGAEEIQAAKLISSHDYIRCYSAEMRTLF